MTTPQAGNARLRSFVQRIENVREEIAALNSDLSEIYKEARAEGWNVPAMKQVVAERHRMSKDANKYRELTDIVELYRDVLAGGTDDALACTRTKDSNLAGLTAGEGSSGEDGSPGPRTSPLQIIQGRAAE